MHLVWRSEPRDLAPSEWHGATKCGHAHISSQAYGIEEAHSEARESGSTASAALLALLLILLVAVTVYVFAAHVFRAAPVTSAALWSTISTI